MRRPSRVFGAFSVCLALTAGSMLAEQGSSVGPLSGQPPADAPVSVAHPKGEAAPEAYGVDALTRVEVQAFAFQGRNPFGDQISSDDWGYRTFTAAGSLLFVGTINLPAGALIESIGIHNCDNSVPGNLTFSVFDYFGDHQFTEIGSLNTSNASFCAYDSLSVGPYAWDTNVGHVLQLAVFQSMVDPTLTFRDVYVRYRRRVSPAPAVATFNDVPIGDTGFQWIEALVAAGITGGTGGGNYSPGNFVTRRQMAIFIAKALGLHWPN